MLGKSEVPPRWDPIRTPEDLPLVEEEIAIVGEPVVDTTTRHQRTAVGAHPVGPSNPTWAASVVSCLLTKGCLTM